MAKNEFDPDFDFEKEYGFDPNEFLDSDLDADIDFSQFDEEQPDAAPEAETEEDSSDFDLDGLDLDELVLVAKSHGNNVQSFAQMLSRRWFRDLTVPTIRLLTWEEVQNGAC